MSPFTNHKLQYGQGVNFQDCHIWKINIISRDTFEFYYAIRNC
jgi:hypothetical protein